MTVKDKDLADDAVTALTDVVFAAVGSVRGTRPRRQQRQGTSPRRPGPDRRETIWMLIVYDPHRRRIEYIRVTPASDIARIRIHVSAHGDRESQVEVTYEFTALTIEEDDFVRRFTPEYYRNWIAKWGTAIRHYLATGPRPRRRATTSLSSAVVSRIRHRPGAGSADDGPPAPGGPEAARGRSAAFQAS